MSAAIVARSALQTSIARYSRSWGLWILLLIAPIGARFFVPRSDGTTIIISVADQLPVMTSSVIGVCLGITVSTLLLPAAYIYLRSNTNRRQPWQIEEVSPASRVAIALGRFGADVAVLFGLLAGLTLAGCFLAWLVLPADTLNVIELGFALWAIAGPALMGLAAIRILFDALPLLRGAGGDFLYFVIWIASIAAPSAAAISKANFGANMLDFGGFVRPLILGSGLTEPNFTIGGADVKPGRIPIDAMAGLLSEGYLLSRLAWVLIAIGVVLLAGLIYRPHRVRNRATLSQRASALLREKAPPAADPMAPPAGRAAWPLLSLVEAEFRLIGSGRLFKLLAALVAMAGIAADYANAALPAALLLLVFALTGHAGRTENHGLRGLTVTTPLDAWTRRGAFVLAAVTWSALIALPHLVVSADVAGFGTAMALGAIGSAAAIGLAAISGSGFAPRLVLLIAWYVYTAS